MELWLEKAANSWADLSSQRLLFTQTSFLLFFMSISAFSSPTRVHTVHIHVAQMVLVAACKHSLKLSCWLCTRLWLRSMLFALQRIISLVACVLPSLLLPGMALAEFQVPVQFEDLEVRFCPSISSTFSPSLFSLSPSLCLFSLSLSLPLPLFLHLQGHLSCASGPSDHQQILCGKQDRDFGYG